MRLSWEKIQLETSTSRAKDAREMGHPEFLSASVVK